MTARRPFRGVPLLFAALTLLAAPRPARATVFVVSLNANIELDTAPIDLQYFNCGANCPALGPRNGAGWAYGYNTGLNTSNWDQQTYSFATMQSYNTSAGGFGFDGTYDPKFVWSTHLEVYLIKTSAGRYFKVRCNDIDQSDLNPITLEIVELTCTDAVAPVVTAPAATKVTQSTCN